MLPRLRAFFSTHPLLRDALLWALPALIIGAALRALLLSYSPYAYWGSDSRSYYSFTQLLLTRGDISLDEKRRYLYPFFLLPVSLLPGSPLRWVAWIQHGFGLLTVIPLAYVLRKSCLGWRWWVVPITLAWVTMPLPFWYEHELLGDTLFFNLLLWTTAGWAAFATELNRARAQRLFWCFFVPLALFMITKPTGRFYWPGVALALVIILAWRRLNWRHWAALVALVLVTLTVGSKKQAAWLLYVAAFPLTQLDTPLHADYKAQIRDLVLTERAQFADYYRRDDAVFNFLENPARDPARPLWAALQKDAKKRAALYFALTLEGIRAEPLRFVELGLQRLLASANPSEFDPGRFAGDYYPRRFEHFYAVSVQEQDGLAQLLLGLPRSPAPPPYPVISTWLTPQKNSAAELVLIRGMNAYLAASDLVIMPPKVRNASRPMLPAHFTPLGWWLLAGLVLSLLPRYRPALGLWALAALGYLLGTFCVSQVNPRYFGAAWPALLPLLAVPADVVYGLITRRFAALKQ